jgi:zona occludens toxin (predicted ATPase)
MIFLQNKALAAPHACTLHVVWQNTLEGHPMMDHGACMVKLTRLPPSMHVLTLITPLISKIKNKFRAMGELKYKFREGFKALKTNVSRKIFSDYFYVGLTGIVCLH